MGFPGTPGTGRKCHELEIDLVNGRINYGAVDRTNPTCRNRRGGRSDEPGRAGIWRSANAEWQRFEATWLGRFILDGYAIADEYRMTDSSGRLIALGMNFRTYDAAKQNWNLKWLNALTGKWTDLAPSELGGVRFDGQSIIYAFKEPVAAHAYTRATYTNISKTHFTWRGEKSDDGKAWSKFMVVESGRSKE